MTAARAPTAVTQAILPTLIPGVDPARRTETLAEMKVEVRNAGGKEITVDINGVVETVSLDDLAVGERVAGGLDPVDKKADPVDVAHNMRDRPDAERLAPVQSTELALVPGAIAGHPEHQAGSLARRANRPQFKT